MQNLGILKMGKSRTDFKSPRRRRSGNLLNRPISRNRPATATISAVAAAAAVGANIKVVIRVRPPNVNEQGDNQRNVVKIVDDYMLIFDPKEETEPFFYHGVAQKHRDLNKRPCKNQQFIFDRVFGYESHNREIFEITTKNLIKSLMDGYNCSVFAYGATGAGKTHTMLGKDGNPGITFLTMSELFDKKAALSEERDFDLGITYLEVYNETVKDLLNPGGPLQLREDGKHGVSVAGITVKRIENSEELFDLLKQGNCNRTQHPTDANAESSRSHAVFQVYLRMKMKTSGEVRMAKLSMIDLAGSERGTATGCNGARFTEGSNINKSLLALGNCINSLADGQRHVPYRDSKLTRLLKDSLGGNCQTVMIANISPSSHTLDDTYNTLKYAARAKTIKSTIKKNVVNCEMHVGHYVKLVEELNKEVDKLKAEVAASKGNVEELKKKNDELEAEIESQKYCKVEERVVKERVDVGGEEEVDENVEILRKFYAERMELLERLHSLENSNKTLIKRIELKEEAKSRLSGLCADTPQKEENRSRIVGMVSRLHKQNSGLIEEIATLHNQNAILKAKSEDLIEKCSSNQLWAAAKLGNLQIGNIELKNQVELYLKLNKVQQNELHARGGTIEKMSKMLRSYHMLIKGLGHMTDNMGKEYEDLVRQVQAPCTVSWDEEVVDSGVSSGESITAFPQEVEAEEEEESTRTKRKLVESVESSTSSLDKTFTLPPTKPKTMTVRAEQLMAKVYRPPPTKKPARCEGTVASPRFNKENRSQRKYHGTMGTAERFPCSSGDPKLPGIRRPIKPINRALIKSSSATTEKNFIR